MLAASHYIKSMYIVCLALVYKAGVDRWQKHLKRVAVLVWFVDIKS